MEFFYVVYSKSKIHGIYNHLDTANIIKNFLQDKAGYINGIPKKFYYIDEIELNKLPDGMTLDTI